MSPFYRKNENRYPHSAEDGFNASSIFDAFFTSDSTAQRSNFGNSGVTTPAVNIIETDSDYMLEMVAPGMKKEYFKVELDNHILTISYDHEDNREGERRGWKYTTHEYNYHSFLRSFELPEIVESGKIDAKYEDGILRLIIPKKEEAKSKPARKITID
jgi:HSP20 family protein